MLYSAITTAAAEIACSNDALISASCHVLYVFCHSLRSSYDSIRRRHHVPPHLVNHSLSIIVLLEPVVPESEPTARVKCVLTGRSTAHAFLSRLVCYMHAVDRVCTTCLCCASAIRRFTLLYETARDGHE